MHILVTGTEGQVAKALAERGPALGGRITAIGRPDLDLSRPETILPALRQAAPDVVVNAAAYTAVDQAETEPEAALAINGQGAAAVAAAAAALGLPVVHLSTDYVFDGTLDRPYRESDPESPLGAYGHSKLAGEKAVAAATRDHAILRTAWVYSPFGKNFVRTMLRLAKDRDEVAVVADQKGSPTSALDIADGVVTVARNLLERPSDDSLRGVFHMTGAGSTTWAGLATHVFEQSARLGGPSARVRPIATAEYPTPAKRPANSTLDCTKLAAVHGARLPEWQSSVAACIRRLVENDRF
ncbi:dTDP-4-dehydrorhamnose reductase [Microvirga sp. GCM10011540]|uniref:dTDP-4-dehydrorhamnose reductase n=1 Tax=Microvirga sp. GCM10011540 TaxID=3317338 RepID=UPI00361E4A2B